MFCIFTGRWSVFIFENGRWSVLNQYMVAGRWLMVGGLWSVVVAGRWAVVLHYAPFGTDIVLSPYSTLVHP